MATFFHSKAGKSTTGVEDMVLLPRVDDSEIVENLRKRHSENHIYTYIGQMLVSVNPYKKLDIYGPKQIEKYQGAAIHESSPHIFAVADRMYRNLLAERENQCVIISGESGAGKTEAAKLIISYLAAVSGQSKKMENLKHIILESNPLLESFGNAKTLRNNNSSRFGKYFEILFSCDTGLPVGGQILSFLLEKSRVVGQLTGERSFHIFYQLIAGATSEEKHVLGLMKPEDYYYLNQSSTYKIVGLDDAHEFQATKNAMTMCGIPAQQQQSIFEILAAILHLGNIEFVEKTRGGATVRDPATLEFPSYLLGVSTDMLMSKLTTRSMMTSVGNQRSSTYDVELNVDQANYTRDALAKTLYSRLFDWIVEAINKAISTVAIQKENACSLGVLDIYGFEIFEKNGFSQFCINYINEKLQQIFIQLTLKSEQEEYASEGIEWTPINFFNNQIVVELIESKNPVGVMAVLDDLCATMHGQSEGADIQFGQKLGMIMKGNPNSAHFVALQNSFILKHYAGDVAYDLDGFVDANRDTLFKDLILLMKSTNKPFVSNLFPESIDKDDRCRPTTAGFKIRDQAANLVKTLSHCVPHYIRCIKPNETKRPGDWDDDRIEHQVHYLNLKENIRIRRAGFAYRESFGKFLKRFAILTPETFPSWRGDTKNGISHIMGFVKLNKNEWQLGRTKLFIRAPESLDFLENLREKAYGRRAAVIQRAWRKYKARQHYRQLRTSVNDLFYGKKDRRRFSLNRDYFGDYLSVKMCPDLMSFLKGRNERVLFSSTVVKYDRKFRRATWTLIITDQKVLLVGDAIVSDGIDKGKIQKVLKRQLEFNEIRSISLSTKADDFFVLHCNEYDFFLSQFFKTEMIAILMDIYSQRVNKDLEVHFVSQFVFRVKKVFWEREGKRTVSFVSDSSALVPSLTSKGKRAIVYVPIGLSNTSLPLANNANNQTLLESSQSSKTADQRQQQVNQGIDKLTLNSFPRIQQQAVLFSQNDVTGSASTNGRDNHSSPVASHFPVSEESRLTAVNSTIQKSPPVPTTIGQAEYAMPPLFAATTERSKAVPIGMQPPPKPKLTKAKALFDYGASESDELSFVAGDVITILDQQDEGWWQGILRGKKGLLPSNYVEKLEVV